MSGCAIAAIVGVVVGFFGIVVIGILAAIALPAYQQYVVRSQIASLQPKLEPLRQAIDEYRTANDACPATNLDVGVSPSLTYYLDTNATRAAEVRVFTSPEGRCGVLVSFRNVTSLPTSAVLTLESDGGRWRCGGTVPDTFLPPQCRAGSSPTP